MPPISITLLPSNPARLSTGKAKDVLSKLSRSVHKSPISRNPSTIPMPSGRTKSKCAREPAYPLSCCAIWNASGLMNVVRTGSSLGDASNVCRRASAWVNPAVIGRPQNITLECLIADTPLYRNEANDWSAAPNVFVEPLFVSPSLVEAAMKQSQ